MGKLLNLKSFSIDGGTDKKTSPGKGAIKIIPGDLTNGSFHVGLSVDFGETTVVC